MVQSDPDWCGPVWRFIGDFNTLATGYGDFRTSVASGRRRATEISVFAYGWLEEGFGLCCVLALMLYNHNISLEKVCRGP